MAFEDNNPDRQSSPQTSWHLSFAEALEWDLSPVDISVSPELRVMSMPPRVDILLLRGNQPTWTAEQLERLPDGISNYSALKGRFIKAQGNALGTIIKMKCEGRCLLFAI